MEQNQAKDEIDGAIEEGTVKDEIDGVNSKNKVGAKDILPRIDYGLLNSFSGS